MRRGFSITLLLLVLINLVGPYAYFAYRVVQIKREMRALLTTLPDEELERIILTPEAFKKAQVEEHEIKVEGKMFDVARTREIDGFSHVYGVYDNDEDNLLSFLNAVLNNLQKDSASSPPSFSFFSVLQYLPESFDYTSYADAVTITAYTAYTRTITEYIPVLDSPPPQIS